MTTTPDFASAARLTSDRLGPDFSGDPLRAETVHSGETETGVPGPRGDAPVLCVEEAAAFLGISKWLLLQQTRRGLIPHKRIGRRVIFSRERLRAWLEADAI